MSEDSPNHMQQVLQKGDFQIKHFQISWYDWYVDWFNNNSALRVE